MKTGLFFGSFNPIHIGHLVIANYMAGFTGLKEVWLVVSPHNPLKINPGWAICTTAWKWPNWPRKMPTTLK